MAADFPSPAAVAVSAQPPRARPDTACTSSSRPRPVPDTADTDPPARTSRASPRPARSEPARTSRTGTCLDSDRRNSCTCRAASHATRTACRPLPGRSTDTGTRWQSPHGSDSQRYARDGGGRFSARRPAMKSAVWRSMSRTRRSRPRGWRPCRLWSSSDRRVHGCRCRPLQGARSSRERTARIRSSSASSKAATGSSVANANCRHASRLRSPPSAGSWQGRCPSTRAWWVREPSCRARSESR